MKKVADYVYTYLVKPTEKTWNSTMALWLTGGPYFVLECGGNEYFKHQHLWLIRHDHYLATIALIKEL